MKKQLIKDGLIWGVILWLFGYILGILLFAFVPHSLIGWFIMPFGILVSLFILLKKINGKTLQYFLKIAIIWTLIAIIFDYLFLVLIFKPADGYYKLDVYLYYALMFVLPLLVGWKKTIINST